MSGTANHRGRRPKLVTKAVAKKHLNSNPGTSNVSFRDEKIKVTGLDPYTDRTDSDSRYETFERVRRFYVKYTNCEQIRDGVGDIVDWVIKHGEDQLNEKLRLKYNGNDLQTLTSAESFEAKLRDDTPGSVSKKVSAGMLGSPVVSEGRTRGASSASAVLGVLKLGKMKRVGKSEKRTKKNRKDRKETNLENESLASLNHRYKNEDIMRSQLREFFVGLDEKMLEEKMMNGLIEYGGTRGVTQLNIKLQKRYGKGIDLSVYDTDKDSLAGVVSKRHNKQKN